jgi:RimJ/RimL family protein N-acetyltransferase
MNLKPIALTGRIVRLEPLNLQHAADLVAAGSDESIWKFMRYGTMDSPEKMADFIRSLLDLQARGSDLPFAVILAATGQAIGMTRYMNIDPANRSLEIGGTWYASHHQRTGVNTESKYLLLQHAFEVQDCIRVQIKTDVRNERSQRAIERIGAVREGVLRDHMILPDGSLRSSVYYSILLHEWPEIKKRLEALMQRSER